jgi:dolichol-phosphate mannosyltransferase
MSFVSGKKLTESTNGFRAFKTSLLKDVKINWHQEWLDKYELEPYMLIKSIQNGYRHLEVPCSKIYPQKTTTKMTPLVSWWNIMKPILYLGLRIRK